jgi:predicted phosphoribosyltransferase
MRAPRRPELGIGAVAADGSSTFDDGSLRRLGLHSDDLAPAARRERPEARPSTTHLTAWLPTGGMAAHRSRSQTGWSC